MAKLSLIMLISALAIVVENTELHKSPLQHLVNDLTDEFINYIQYNFLCNLNPLVLPSIKAENSVAEFIISKIQVIGLENIQRIEDVKVQDSINTGNQIVNRNYNISTTFGIRDIKIEFRVEALNILLNSLVDFRVSSGLTQMDIHFQLNISPMDRKAQLQSILIENLSKIDWNLSGKVLHSDWLLWIFENKIKGHIDSQIANGLSKGLNEAKEVINKKIETLLYFFPHVDYCKKESCKLNPSNNLSTPAAATTFENEILSFGPISLEKGDNLLEQSNNYEIVIKYKNKTIGLIPSVMFYPEFSTNTIKIDGYLSPVSIPSIFLFLSVIRSDEIANGKFLVTFSNSLGNLFFDGYKKYDSYFYSQPSTYKYFDLPNVRLQNFYSDPGSSFYMKEDGIFRFEEKITDFANIIGYYNGVEFIIRARNSNNGQITQFTLQNGQTGLKLAKGLDDTVGLYLPNDLNQLFNLMPFVQRNLL